MKYVPYIGDKLNISMSVSADFVNKIKKVQVVTNLKMLKLRYITHMDRLRLIENLKSKNLKISTVKYYRH